LRIIVLKYNQFNRTEKSKNGRIVLNNRRIKQLFF
jgi:hypothetical protein